MLVMELQRRVLGLRIKDLAEKTGLTCPAISALEHGWTNTTRTRKETRRKLEEVLGLPYKDLIKVVSPLKPAPQKPPPDPVRHLRVPPPPIKKGKKQTKPLTKRKKRSTL